MSFCATGELNFNAKKSLSLGDIMLPGGELLISGPKVSFRPGYGQTTYGYEIDDGGTITERYLNGKQVSVKTWQIEIAKDEGLRNSNFGIKPLCGTTSLLDRKFSRFLWEEKPSTSPAKKMPKEASTTMQKSKQAG
ncbi:MAG: hypothetical protein LBI47_00355 [Puniceicoccales bacterium]|jgi:hypothetical protein|nr:hypothetical protein [Puniceicoccales bacterium]